MSTVQTNFHALPSLIEELDRMFKIRKTMHVWADKTNHVKTRSSLIHEYCVEGLRRDEKFLQTLDIEIDMAWQAEIAQRENDPAPVPAALRCYVCKREFVGAQVRHMREEGDLYVCTACIGTEAHAVERCHRLNTSLIIERHNQKLTK